MWRSEQRVAQLSEYGTSTFLRTARERAKDIGNPVFDHIIVVEDSKSSILLIRNKLVQNPVNAQVSFLVPPNISITDKFREQMQPYLISDEVQWPREKTLIVLDHDLGKNKNGDALLGWDYIIEKGVLEKGVFEGNKIYLWCNSSDITNQKKYILDEQSYNDNKARIHMLTQSEQSHDKTEFIQIIKSS